MAEQNLNSLEKKSIIIIKEAKPRFKNLAILWNMSEDSTVLLALVRKAFGKVPFPVIYIDNGLDFKESYKFINDVKKKWKLNLLVAKSAATRKMSGSECCSDNKIKALRKLIDKRNFDGLIVSAKGNQQDSDVKSKQGSSSQHIKIQPMRDWTELDVWSYAKKERMPFNPLYLSKEGYRYRSLGCTNCAKPSKSEAKSIDEIIAEIKGEGKRADDKSDRNAEKEKDKVMERLKALGYM